MIRSRNLIYISVRSHLKEDKISIRQICGNRRPFLENYIRGRNFMYCSTEAPFTVSSEVKMSIFKFSDYDCIGFDLDNTLLRYNVTNMVHLEYETLAAFLIKRGYNSKHLLKPLEDKDLDFMQKGLFLDFERGNILRISTDGTIRRACHGTTLLNVDEIREIYPNQQWDVTSAFCNDMVSTWNGPYSLKMRSLLDYFDISASLIFARLVDTLDEEHGKSLDVYRIWPDILDGLTNMFDIKQFQVDDGQYFPSIKKSPHKYFRKCSATTISWLREIKKNHITYLITGSNIDFADFSSSFAIGEDWKSLFDIVIYYAKKPGFFTGERPFLSMTNYEGDVVKSSDLVRGGIYSQGNWKGLTEFFSRISQKSDPRCLYIGDNLLQDIYVPSAYVNCDTVAVIEEQMSEGMVHQGLSHCDEKVLNSTIWGSYFCLKDSKTSTDSIWGHIIKEYAKLCIPELDLVAQHPLDKPYTCFHKNGKKYCGYYPSIPLSISNM